MTCTLYGYPETATFGPHAVLAEIGLDFTVETVDVPSGGCHAPEYLAVNPAGYVPALKFNDGPQQGQVIYEAAAIMLYLADLHGQADLAPAVDDPDRALFLRSLFYLSSTVQEAYKHYYYPARYTVDEAGADAVQKRSLELLKARWQIVENNLTKAGPYALGARFSLVDVYTAMLASWDPHPDTFYEQFPSIRRSRDLVVDRPRLRDAAREHAV